MKEKSIVSIITDTELELRRDALAQVLKAHGFEVTKKEDKLVIKHSSGFKKEAYFRKARISDEFSKGGSEAVARNQNQIPPQQEGIDTVDLYIEAGKKALESSRADYIHSYFQSIQTEMTKESRVKALEKVQQKSKLKEEPSISR